jgi:hypothetical protein
MGGGGGGGSHLSPRARHKHHHHRHRPPFFEMLSLCYSMIKDLRYFLYISGSEKFDVSTLS